MGYFAGGNLTTGSNNIDIGNPRFAGEANTIRVGTQEHRRTRILPGSLGSRLPGRCRSNSELGKLGIAVSSVRFKEAIKPMDKASEAILALKPVTFRYKEEIDPDGIPQFGLVAEQWKKSIPI